MSTVFSKCFLSILCCGCALFAAGCANESRQAAPEVDPFLVGTTELARRHGADTVAARLLEDARFTADAQRALISHDRPVLLAGVLLDIEMTNDGWMLRLTLHDYLDPNIVFALACDSLTGARLYADATASSDSTSTSDKGRLAVVATVLSVSRALYSVEADTWGSGEYIEYGLYLDVSDALIARGEFVDYYFQR